MKSTGRESVIRPGVFAMPVAADSRRGEFDFGNESLMVAGIQPDVVFIGDSITHLWELQAYFSDLGKVVINRGIGGDTSTFVNKRFEADALQLNPKLIVMKIGTNDLGWMFEMLSDSIPDTICDNIADMAGRAQIAGIPLAICSILPIWGPSFYPVPGFAERKNKQIAEINARLQKIAEEKGAIYVDYHSEMVDADGNLIHDMADDGIHPHSSGYAVMARILKATLKERGIW